jgi:hypothetical protein
MVVFGSDFQYKDAHWNYKNMDNMIEYMNKYHSDKYTFKYSTPSEYVDELAKKNVAWPTKYDDMFPYASGDHDWWTGYFSSRANAKGYVRRASHNLHASGQIYTEKVLDQSAKEEDIDAALMAHYTLSDDLGVLQHHDAVSGTAKQQVADDYNKKLFTGMNQNNAVYNKFIGQKVEKEMAHKSNETWTQCFRSNSTYLDCPISAYYNESAPYTMSVAVQNPSTVDLQEAKIAVPHGKYDVKVFDKSSQKFEDASSQVSCQTDTLDLGRNIESCFLTVPVKTDAKSVSLLQVSESTTADLKVDSKDIELDHALESNNLKLTFKGFDKESSKLNFEVYDKISEVTELFDFSVGFWQSYYKPRDGAEMNSGAYVFRQMSEQYFPMSYGAYKAGSITLGESVQQMDFTFGKTLYHESSESMQSSVHFTLDQELGLIRINVQLEGLPFSQVYNGYEVVP